MTPDITEHITEDHEWSKGTSTFSKTKIDKNLREVVILCVWNKLWNYYQAWILKVILSSINPYIFGCFLSFFGDDWFHMSIITIDVQLEPGILPVLQFRFGLSIMLFSLKHFINYYSTSVYPNRIRSTVSKSVILLFTTTWLYTFEGKYKSKKTPQSIPRSRSATDPHCRDMGETW